MYQNSARCLATVLIASLCLAPALAKSTTQTTFKFASMFTEIDHTGIELAICRDLSEKTIAQRTRIFESEGENWGHVTLGRRELRTWLMPDIGSAVDSKGKINFIKSLRSIIQENKIAGTPFFRGDSGHTTLAFDGWETARPNRFVYEKDGNIYKGDTKQKGILRQRNLTQTQQYAELSQVL